MKLLISISFLLLFFVTMIGFDEQKHGPRRYCTETSKVISVDEIFYRGGWVTLENGQQVKVGQESVKVGDSRCVSYDQRDFLKNREDK